MPWPIHDFGTGNMSKWLMMALSQKETAGQKKEDIERQLMLAQAQAGQTTPEIEDVTVRGQRGARLSPQAVREQELFGEGGAQALRGMAEKEDRRLKRQELNAHTDRVLKALPALEKLSPEAQLTFIDTMNQGFEGTGFKMTDVNNAKDAIAQMQKFSSNKYYEALGIASKDPTIENIKNFNDSASVVARHSKHFPEIDLVGDRKRITGAIEQQQKIKLKQTAPGVAPQRPTPMTLASAIKNLSFRFYKQDALGNIVTTSENQGMHRIAQKKLAELAKEKDKSGEKREVYFPDIVNQSEDFARNVENRYWEYLDAAQGRQKLVQKVNSTFKSEYGYIPRRKPR